MTKILGTNVASTVVPFTTLDSYPTHDARYGKGGYRSVSTIAERDSIPAPRRTVGMRVKVTADANALNNTDWDWNGLSWEQSPTILMAQQHVNQANAAALSAQLARDSLFTKAKGAKTIADARALVADNEIFMVYLDGAVSYQVYKRLSATTQEYLGDISSASSSTLTSGDVFLAATPRTQVYNDAAVIIDAGRLTGFTIPSNATGADSFTIVDIPVTQFRGRTLRIVQKYSATVDFLSTTDINSTFAQYRNSTSFINIVANNTSRVQTGTEIIQIGSVQVPLDAEYIGLVTQVARGNLGSASVRSLQITGVSYQIISGQDATQTIADINFDNKLKNALDIALFGIAYTTEVLTVGSGQQYATPKLANDAITQVSATNRSEIRVSPGVYNTDPEGWTLARFATLKGVGASQPVIHYDGADAADHSTLETLWVRRDAVIENIKITGRNVRYAVHAESGTIASGATQNCRILIKNAWIEHLGNINNNWTSQAAFGCGISSGWYIRSENSTYKGPFCGFSYHTSDGFTRPTVVENIGDTFIGTGGDTTTSGMALRLQPIGSGQMDKHVAIGCEFDGSVFYYPDPWLPTTLAYQPANHCEIEMSGYGNTPTVFRVSDFGLALRIRAVAGAGSSIVVGGNAVPIIFGTVRTFQGVENIPAYVDGSFDVSGVGVGINKNVFITSLGKRLGDCTGNNKLLTVSVNGAAPINVIFDQDYTNVSNETIISQLQTILGPTSTVIIDTYSPGNNYHPHYTDEEKNMQNISATVGIPKGSILAYDGSRKRVRLMTSGDATSLFAGVALEDIYPGTFGRVKTRGWLWIQYIRSNLEPNVGTVVFGETMSVGSTPGRVQPGGTQGLLRAVRVDAVEVAP